MAGIEQQMLTARAGHAQPTSPSPPLQTAQPERRSSEDASTSPPPIPAPAPAPTPSPTPRQPISNEQYEQLELLRTPFPSPPLPADAGPVLYIAPLVVASQSSSAESSPSEPLRACIVCCEYYHAEDLIKACRANGCEYRTCRGCLAEMFDTASSSPPKCCTIFQVYALPEYPREKADAYARMLEEWLTTDKFYCPVPRCSAFIPPRLLPAQWAPVPAVTQTVLVLLDELEQMDSSRFFRGINDISRTQRFTELQLTPLSLDDLREKASRSLYTSIIQLGEDIAIIATNAKIFDTTHNGAIRKAAHGLEAVLTKAPIRFATELFHYAGPPPAFPCPACNTSICNKGCKDVAHDPAECDFSHQMYEKTLLATGGAKRCPACKTAVRRMHGCPSMSCHCGASWCWECQRSLLECDGECGPGDGAFDQNFNDFQLFETPDPSDEAPEQEPDMPRNLDGGGDARWAQSDADFGPEFEEDGYRQIWSCTHTWDLFKRTVGGCDNGDLSNMSCNRCTAHVDPPTDTQVSTAFDCSYCKVIVCSHCMAKYNAENQQT